MSLTADVQSATGSSAWQLVVQQSGQRYFSFPFGATSAGGWRDVTVSNLTAANFDTNPWAGSGLPPDGNHPDFGQKAAPIQFGFMFGNRVSGGNATFTNTFGLDNFSLVATPPSCDQILDKDNIRFQRVYDKDSLSLSPTVLLGFFTPKYNGSNLGLEQAAKICGIESFNWIQKVTNLPDPSPFYQINPSDPMHPIHITSSNTPFNDPVPNGYTYKPLWDSYPFYYDPSTDPSGRLPESLLSAHKTQDQNTLLFNDGPANPCLPYDAFDVILRTAGNVIKKANGEKEFDINDNGCNGLTAPVGSELAFRTNLAGIRADGSPVDFGMGVSWTSDFNGTSGGVATLVYSGPLDPYTGSGGITITEADGVTIIADVPEPSTFLLVVSGLLGALCYAVSRGRVSSQPDKPCEPKF